MDACDGPNVVGVHRGGMGTRLAASGYALVNGG
jgi:hypothetical protein